MATFQREAKLYSDPATQDSSRLLQLVQAFLDNVRMCVGCPGLRRIGLRRSIASADSPSCRLIRNAPETA